MHDARASHMNPNMDLKINQEFSISAAGYHQNGSIGF
jgi:hypothetical protein